MSFRRCEQWRFVTSSIIQTILSVSEFFLFKKVTDSTASLRVADYTAGWDLHPTPKIVFHLLYSL